MTPKSLTTYVHTLYLVRVFVSTLYVIILWSSMPPCRYNNTVQFILICLPAVHYSNLRRRVAVSYVTASTVC